MSIIYLAVGKEIMRFKKAKTKFYLNLKYVMMSEKKSGSLLKKMTKTWKIAI